MWPNFSPWDYKLLSYLPQSSSLVPLFLGLTLLCPCSRFPFSSFPSSPPLPQPALRSCPTFITRTPILQVGALSPDL